MALHFDYKNVSDRKVASTHPNYPDQWHPVGEALVWMSLVCGYNKITEANAEKIAQRLMEYQMVKGPLLEYGTAEGPTGQRKLYIDLPEVKRYIGLSTNASSMTDAEWRKHLHEHIIKREVSDIRYYRREQPNALDTFEQDCKTIAAQREGEAA